MLGDAAKVGGLAGYEKAAEAAVGFPRSFRIALWLHQHFRIERPLAGELAERFERLLLERLMLWTSATLSTTGWSRCWGARPPPRMHEVLGRRAVRVEQALAALRLQYPDYAELLESRYLGRVSLRLEEDAFRDMLEESVVSQEIFNDLDRSLGERRRDSSAGPASTSPSAPRR